MHRVCIRLYVRKMYTRSVITTAGLSRPVLESWTPNPFNKSGMTHQCYGRGREVWRLTRRTKNDALDRWMSRRLGSRPSAEWWGPCARDQVPSSPSRAWILSGWGAGRRFGSAFDRGMHRGTAGSSLPLDGRSIFCSFAGGSGAAPWAWRAASAPRSGVGSVASDSWAGSGHTMHATVPRGTSCRLECPQVPCSPHSSVFRPQGKVLHGPGPQVLKSHGSWAFPRVSWFLGRLLA